MYFLEYWSSSAQLKEVWRIKGIVNESVMYEHDSVELSDDEQEPKQSTSSTHSENEDDDESCDSDNSEVCGAISSNKFSALDISD